MASLQESASSNSGNSFNDLTFNGEEDTDIVMTIIDNEDSYPLKKPVLRGNDEPVKQFDDVEMSNYLKVYHNNSHAGHVMG